MSISTVSGMRISGTTPSPCRWIAFDAGIQKDAVPPRPDQEPMNLSWNAFWDVMTNHILGIKALFMFDTKLSVNAFIQYNTDYDGIITNFRIRYNPKEGNDLYMVFNEDGNTDLYRELPYLPVYNSRTVMLK